MPPLAPQPLDDEELQARRDRVARIARQLEFVGRVEYHHKYSRSGGAQYRLGPTADDDLLRIYAEAFEREATPGEFSLTAMIAHERGHQLIIRHRRIARIIGRQLSRTSEEIVASLLGAWVCESDQDCDELILKAIADLLDHGEEPAVAQRRVIELWLLLGELL